MTNREVKFKFWSVGGMHAVEQIDFIARQVWLSDGDQRDMDYGILLQYTGLQDKNGKDVYEGDILKLKHNAENVIGGSTMVAEVKYYEDGLCFGFRTGEKSYDWWHCNDDMFGFEILGNIYENPEISLRD